MSKPTADQLEKLQAFIDSLPEESKGKCALCNETLCHIVKQAEVATGAGTATVTKALAEQINHGAAPGDRVSGGQLRDRVRYNEGAVKVGNSPNKNRAAQAGNSRGTSPSEESFAGTLKLFKSEEPVYESKRLTEEVFRAVDKLCSLQGDPLRDECILRIHERVLAVKNARGLSRPAPQ